MAEDYEILREGEEIILRIDFEKDILPPSIEDNDAHMAKVIDIMKEIGTVTKIILHQKRNYEYDYDQTLMLLEIAKTHNTILKENLIEHIGIHDPKYMKYASPIYVALQHIVFHVMKGDPLGAYVELLRKEREEKVKEEASKDAQYKACQKHYISVIKQITKLLGSTRLVEISRPYLAGYKLGDRSVYARVFMPMIKPDFMFTKLMSAYPLDAEELASYTVGTTEVTIFKQAGNIQTLYHLNPPEFSLSEDKYEVLDAARKILAEHRPKKSEFVNPARMREVFFNVGKDLIDELVQQKGLEMKDEDLKDLTEILVRYTVGFGLIEVLLQDEGIQDISINSPMGQIPLFVVHGDYDDCITNIIPTSTEAESWASKLRMISGRPLDEANPLLDTELELPGARTRVSAITYPLDPSGLAFSFRRHRDKPWTLPLFITYKMINPMAAGLISFLVDGTRSMLICGTRSSGKSSFLSAVLIEIMRRYRIITVEDTLELPTGPMRKLGFNIQPMKVAPALAAASSEMSASDGIRATLRLGDSALIVGEVRSQEAKALYEAMRVGAAANVVAGTIHGDSPYGIFDRVVNDIGVPKTSFKATDICIIANPVKSADGLHKYRRITQITEVRKDWTDDPQAEGGFVDLMKYNAKVDELEVTDDMLNGESDILKAIASGIKEFAGNWDAVWQNIELRTKIKQAQVEYAKKTDNDDLLEAPFTIRCNDQFHLLAESVKEEVGSLDPKLIFDRWEQWLKRNIKRIALDKNE